VIDTVAGAATRAASISVSPLDQVEIAYLTNSTAAGRVRIVYCDAGCSSLTNFVTMTDPTDTVENTTQAATGMVKIGTGWCKMNSSTYYPTVVYHGNTAASVRYAVCANSSLSACKIAGGWSVSTVVANAAPISMGMYLDSTITQDLVKIIVKPAAATALTTYTSASGCNAPVSFTAGANIVGATTAGTIWYDLMKDMFGFFHVVANDSTTSIVYMNSNSSNFQASTWNAAGTLDTMTLPAVGFGAGGAALANGSEQIYTSYGLAATPFDLHLAVIGDITLSSANASVGIYKADVSGNINVTLSAGTQARNVSVAAISTGEPGVVYTDHSSGTLASARLKYAFRNGNSATSEWTISTIPDTINPTFPSLAYDINNRPWITYYDSGNFRYYMATNNATDGSGTWLVNQLPLGAKVASSAVPATDDTAAAMYYSGGISQPVAIYINGTAAGGTGVRAVRVNPLNGRPYPTATVDSLGASFGTRLSSDYDTNGNIVVAYYDLTTRKVKFSYSSNGGVSWSSPASITSAGVGREGLSIKLNPSTHRPAVSYYNKAANEVYYNTCTTDLSSCNAASNWTQTTAQSATAVGVSGFATINEQLLNTSLTFTSSGVPYISYMTGALAGLLVNNGLMVTDSTTGFTPTLPTPLATNTTSNLSGVSAMSFGQYGINVSSVRNSLGDLINLYVGPNNWLYSTSCGD
jgi:hypothetical protein